MRMIFDLQQPVRRSVEIVTTCNFTTDCTLTRKYQVTVTKQDTVYQSEIGLMGFSYYWWLNPDPWGAA